MKHNRRLQWRLRHINDKSHDILLQLDIIAALLAVVSNRHVCTIIIYNNSIILYYYSMDVIVLHVTLLYKLASLILSLL